MNDGSLFAGNRWEWRLRWRLGAVIFAMGMGLFCLSGKLGAPREVMAFNQENLVRLHVIANSDLAYDQQVKLRVRDRLLKEAARWLVGVKDRDVALRIIKDKAPWLVAAANDELRRNGCNYGAKMEVGVFPFPARKYAFGWLPAGDYCAVRVILGSGVGRNWWCVLFPPLCFMSEDGQVDSGANAGPGRAREKVVYRWRLLEEMLKKKEIVMDDFRRGLGHYLFIQKEKEKPL